MEIDHDEELENQNNARAAAATAAAGAAAATADNDNESDVSAHLPAIDSDSDDDENDENANPNVPQQPSASGTESRPRRSTAGRRAPDPDFEYDLPPTGLSEDEDADDDGQAPPNAPPPRTPQRARRNTNDRPPQEDTRSADARRFFCSVHQREGARELQRGQGTGGLNNNGMHFKTLTKSEVVDALARVLPYLESIRAKYGPPNRTQHPGQPRPPALPRDIDELVVKLASSTCLLPLNLVEALNILPYNAGAFTANKCPFCKANRWPNETIDCCQKGKVGRFENNAWVGDVEPIVVFDSAHGRELAQYVFGQHPLSRTFMANVRAFNQALSPVARAQTVKQHEGHAPSSFTLQGTSLYFSPQLNPDIRANEARFAQIFFINGGDEDAAAARRMNIFNWDDPDRLQIMRTMGPWVRQSPIFRGYQMAYDYIREHPGVGSVWVEFLPSGVANNNPTRRLPRAPSRDGGRAPRRHHRARSHGDDRRAQDDPPRVQLCAAAVPAHPRHVPHHQQVAEPHAAVRGPLPPHAHLRARSTLHGHHAHWCQGRTLPLSCRRRRQARTRRPVSYTHLTLPTIA